MTKIFNNNEAKTSSAFTIVELLVVIVVIGILASITIVSYRGITQKATASTLQADLSNASKQIKLFQASDANGNYPTAINCTNPTATEICIKPSANNSFIGGYTVNNSSNPKTFTLTETSSDGTVYNVTDSTSPAVGAYTDPTWITIGTQTWARANLNVGTRIDATSSQINNSTVEKYCYGDTDAGCTNTDSNGVAYGALYQWDEAMQYANTEGAQGICPVDSHIPTDADWKTLEMFLSDMTQAVADTTGWRGTDEGTKLKSGGSSGLNIPLAGYSYTGGFFDELSLVAYLWSSSESSPSAWSRYLYSSSETVLRDTDDKALGLSVRCVGN